MDRSERAKLYLEYIDKAPEIADKIRTLESENAALRAEVSRYRGMILYAHSAPTFDSCKSILMDAIDGVNGAENYDEIKGERETLRARVAVLEDKLKVEHDVCMATITVANDSEARIALLEKALRHIVQWSDAVWTSGYGGEVHPAWLDVQEGRAALDAMSKERK